MISRILHLIAVIFIFSVQAFCQSDCSIKDLKVVKSDCDVNKKFSVTINFVYTNPGQHGFKIQGNGKVYGTFTTLPVVIHDLNADCTTPYEFVVRDIDFPECSQSIELGKVCCPTASTCHQQIINFSSGECNNSGTYKINFDVLHYGDKGLGFDLKVNGVFHSFHKYSELPLKNIEVTGSGSSDDKIVVCENDNPHCCDSLSYPSPCECNFYDISTQVAECNATDMTYYYRLNFKHGTVSDSFYVAGSNSNSTKYAYNKLPVLVGPIKFGEKPDLLIADKKEILCFEGLELEPIHACLTCELSNLQYYVLPCIGEQMYIALKFKAVNPGVKGFTIRGSGIVYGQNYSYNDSIHYIGPFIPNCGLNYEFVIVDNANINCKTQINLTEKLCCKACDISIPSIEPYCTNDLKGIFLNFTSSLSEADSFKITINNVVVGTFKKTTDPLKIKYPFVNGSNNFVIIQSKFHPDCIVKKEFKWTCEQMPCNFELLGYELTECTADGQFKIQLKFNPVGTHGSGFYAKINDQLFGPLTYGQAIYTLGPINKACNGLRIQLKDAQNELCNFVVEKELKKCCDEPKPCEIKLESIETICFDNKVIGLKIVAPGIEGNGYKLLVDGVEVGLYKYVNFPVLVNITPRAEGKFVIKIIDIQDATCFKIFEPTLNCNNCSIQNIAAKAIDCKEEKVKFGITFDAINAYSDSVVIWVNGVKLGKFHKNQQPIATEFLPKGITYKIRIFDASKELCNTVVEIKEFDCSTATEDYKNDKIAISSTQGYIHFNNLFENQSYDISLYTIDGKTIQSKHHITNSKTYSLQHNSLSSQLVIVKIEIEGKVVSRLLFIE